MTVLTHALTIVVIALVVGVPVGLALGRWAWRLTAGGLGFADDSIIPIGWLLLVGPISVVVTALLAAGFSSKAARISPARILRND